MGGFEIFSGVRTSDKYFQRKPTALRFSAGMGMGSGTPVTPFDSHMLALPLFLCTRGFVTDFSFRDDSGTVGAATPSNPGPQTAITFLGTVAPNVI